MNILVLNAGSSSQKSCLYQLRGALPDHPPAPAWEGKIEWGGDQAELRVRNTRGEETRERVVVDSRRHAIEQLLAQLWSGPARVLSSPSEVDVAGHRIVHGGAEFEQPTVITQQVKSAIARLAEFAPLHNQAELEGIEIIEQQVGSIPQIAVFDTGFHCRMPQAASVYAGPYEWYEAGIRRYGFHGINHQFCAERAAQILGKDLPSLRLITCHLGNGCSLAAIRGGRSVDTTMGFTPLEGLVMGTRSGSVDPGILTYLLRSGRLTAQELDAVLNSKSGLLGISGVSADMRAIISAMKSGHARAKLAFDIFVHRLQAGIGAMAAVLGGLDALIFTAGIGENSPEIRSAALENLGFLGIRLDAEKNAKSPPDEDVAMRASAVRVLLIRAQEDWAIARHCWRIASTARAEARGGSR